MRPPPKPQPSSCFSPSFLIRVANGDGDDNSNNARRHQLWRTTTTVLDIRKGQPESVLRDIMCGRSRRKGKCSSAVQFLIQLLSFLLKDMEEDASNSKDSWIHSLKRCLSESEFELEEILEDSFDKGSDGYEMLESSQKLKLLTFLCDEALSTIEMRSWIEEQNAKFAEKAKEARESLNAAKEKEKAIKPKLQDKIAKAVIAKRTLLMKHEAEIKSNAYWLGLLAHLQATSIPRKLWKTFTSEDNHCQRWMLYTLFSRQRRS